MQMPKLVATAAFTIASNLAIADNESLVVDRAISREQALQRVHALFDKFCRPNPDCGVGAERPTADCPFTFIVIVPIPEGESGKRFTAVWLSLDRRGRVVALSETREGACASA